MKQLKRNPALLIILLSFMLLLISCGGGGGDGDGASPAPAPGPGPAPAPLVGVFKNSPAEGTFYETATLTGKTSDTGLFNYRDGEQVTFYLGDNNNRLTLGSALGATEVTPVDLVPGATNVLSPRVTNIARLLQTLDEDGDPGNGIRITSECNNRIAAYVAANPINFSDTADFEAKMIGLLASLNAAPSVFTADTPRTLRTAAEARLQLETSMKGPVGEITLTIGASSIVADGSSSVAVRATVKNTEGSTLVAVPVSFSTTYGSLSSLAAHTNAHGIAEVLLTSSTSIGTAVVRASTGGFEGSASVEFTADAPASVAGVVLTAAPSTVNPGGTSTLTGRVTDSNGNAVAGETLVFDITTNTSGASLASVSATTNVNGSATVQYTAGNAAGVDTVRCRALSNNTAGTTLITVDATAQVVGSLTLTTGASSIVADGSSSVAVRGEVTSTGGIALSGVTVTFSTTLGTLSASSATTNASGIAEVTLTAGTVTGTPVITAAASGFEQTATVQFAAGPPAQVVVTAAPSTVNAGGTSTITAYITDGNNNTVAGETVTFSLSVNASGGSLASATGTTNVNGAVSVLYTAGIWAGTDSIRFRATSNNTIGITTVTVDAPAPIIPTKISLRSSSSSVRSDNSDSSIITATVLDADNSVLKGVTVRFNTDFGQISAASVETDEHGEARINFQSGTVDPSNQVATITGRVSNLTSMVPVQILGSTLELASTTQIIPNDGTIKDTLFITVRDAAGRPVPDAAVSLSSSGTGSVALNPASGTSDVTGKLAVTVEGTVAGDATVTVTALNVTRSTTYSVFAAGTPVFGIASLDGDPDYPDPYRLHTNVPLEIIVNTPDPTSNVRVATSFGTLVNPATGQSGQVLDIDKAPDDTVTVRFTSSQAGLATIQVFDVANGKNHSVRIVLTAPVEDAAFITLQSSASVVAPSVGTENTVTVKATVRTSAATNYQVVGEAPVVFSIENAAGGGEHISPVIVYTDDKGEAKTTFTSGQLSSLTPVIVAAQVIGKASTGRPLANVFTFNDNAALPADTRDTITRAAGSFATDGFEAGQKIRIKGSQFNDGTYIVDAVTAGALTLMAGEILALEAAHPDFSVTILAVSDTTPITIGGTAGSVVIGVGTVIEDPDATATHYKLPMAVQVVDHSGKGIAGAVVSLHLWPAYYRTGGWYDQDPDPVVFSYTAYVSGAFPNEDTNENLIMEPWEDVNGDGFLTPPSSAGGSIPATVTADENGVATFNLVYLKSYGRWITSRITATTMVLGTEYSSRRFVPLPVMKSDLDTGNLLATNPLSPYPLGFRLHDGGTATWTFPVFRGPIGGLDDTYTAAEGTFAGRDYSFTDPAGTYQSGDVLEDTIGIQGWVQTSDGLKAIYHSEPVRIYFE